MTNTPNERISLLSKMIGTDPKFWPYPISRNFNLRLLEVKEAYVKMQTTVQKDWLNPLQIMHGGYLITLMDEAMGLCVYTLNHDKKFATINLNADFFASSKEGDIIIIIAEIEKVGKQAIHASARIENEAGRILTKSSSNFFALQPRNI
ncbi:MAG: PaaI family thioesterase [Chitinophagales bacterium]|nr:PaaI family thioesterase [Chitinophagales bacterium]MCZ2392738.1 PaaI family thioesterase [Chitinophagales bacterium]